MSVRRDKNESTKKRKSTQNANYKGRDLKSYNNKPSLILSWEQKERKRTDEAREKLTLYRQRSNPMNWTSFFECCSFSRRWDKRRVRNFPRLCRRYRLSSYWRRTVFIRCFVDHWKQSSESWWRINKPEGELCHENAPHMLIYRATYRNIKQRERVPYKKITSFVIRLIST